MPADREEALAGETVRDTYDLTLPHVPTAPVTLQVILYRPDDGGAIAVWEQGGGVNP